MGVEEAIEWAEKNSFSVQMHGSPLLVLVVGDYDFNESASRFLEWKKTRKPRPLPRPMNELEKVSGSFEQEKYRHYLRERREREISRMPPGTRDQELHEAKLEGYIIEIQRFFPYGREHQFLPYMRNHLPIPPEQIENRSFRPITRFDFSRVRNFTEYIISMLKSYGSPSLAVTESRYCKLVGRELAKHDIGNVVLDLLSKKEGGSISF